MARPASATLIESAQAEEILVHTNPQGRPAVPIISSGRFPMPSINRLKGALAVLSLLLAGSAAAAPSHSKSSVTHDIPHRVSAASAFENNLRPSVLRAGQAVPHWSLRERMAHYHVPGVAVAVLQHGKVVFAAGYGVREAGGSEPVDADTLFSVGSVSKVVTAAATLRLEAQGTLVLDRNVADYLTSWQIPPDPKFPNAVVTLRMLMSHTSGLNVHGFMDFPPGKPYPTLLQTLDGAAPATNDPVRLVYQPGSRYHYSGGGVQVEQLVMEDVTGLPLQAIANAQVFRPLGMHRSTFVEPLPAGTANVAKAHDRDGNPDALPRGWQTFAEAAASGLWSNANELGSFVGALIRSYQGSDDFLPRQIASDMMTEVSPSPFGLGVGLAGAGETRFFYKGGANDDYLAWIEGHLETGDGLVILTNGSNGGELYHEIRNAVADTLGWRVNRPVQAIRLGPAEQRRLQDFAGTYRVDDKLPMDLQQRFADTNADAIDIRVKDRVVSIEHDGHVVADLLPLTPTRFVAANINHPVGTLQIVFHRNAMGQVPALTALMDSATTYYRRQPAKQ